MRERVTVGPNPASDQISIYSDTWSSVKQVEIVDLNGKSVYKSATNLPSNSISLKGISTGIYILKISKANGQTSAHKIVVAK